MPCFPTKNNIFLVFMHCFLFKFSKLAIFSIDSGNLGGSRYLMVAFHALRLQEKISMPLMLQVMQQSVFQLQRPASD